MLRDLRKCSIILLLTMAWSGFALAEEKARSPFDRGTVRATGILGAGSSFDENYVILGVGAGYFIADGLEIGLNWQTWLGGDPRINQITPEITYVLRSSSRISPYAGVLYRRTFISGLDDLSAYGARAGIFTPAGERLYVGIGAVYLRYSGCSTSEYRDCSDTYPEVMFSVPF